jgi:hypothetical protein
MKIVQFQLRGNNSLCAGAFQLVRGRAPAQLRGNIGNRFTVLLRQLCDPLSTSEPAYQLSRNVIEHHKAVSSSFYED